jgi:tRNA modification GTPase
VDEVLCAVMRAPRTFTREDVVEITCHGGILSTKTVFDTVLECGARLALPGEFTQRAFSTVGSISRRPRRWRT